MVDSITEALIDRLRWHLEDAKIDLIVDGYSEPFSVSDVQIDGDLIVTSDPHLFLRPDAVRGFRIGSQKHREQPTPPTPTAATDQS